MQNRHQKSNLEIWCKVLVECLVSIQPKNIILVNFAVNDSF